MVKKMAKANQAKIVRIRNRSQQTLFLNWTAKSCSNRVVTPH